MKEILKIASEYKVGNMENYIIRNSLKKEIAEDKVINILTKEISNLIISLLSIKDDRK